VVVSGWTSGGSALSQVVQPVVEVHVGALPTLSATPSPLRSAGSCSSRIAFGLIGFSTPPAGVPPPEAVGGVTPRAKPSPSHSLVTATHWLELFRYSTRNQPSIRFQLVLPVASAVALLVTAVP